MDMTSFLERVNQERADLARKHQGTIMPHATVIAACDVLKNNYGINPTEVQFLSVICPGSETYGMLCEFGVGDTGICDEVGERFFQYLLKRGRPIYRDQLSDDDIRQIDGALLDAAKRMGIAAVD